MTERLDYRTAAPEGVKTLLACYGYLESCGLPTTLVDLVCLRCSQINGCAFCIDMHSRSLTKHGFSMDKLMLVSVWKEAKTLFSPQEQAALAWAQRVTEIAGDPIDDDECEDVRKVFSEKEVVDLTLTIGVINAFNRLGISFQATPAAVKAYDRAITQK